MPADANEPAAAAAVVEKRPKVQGIIFNAAQPLAIVNGKAVNVGDRVGNFQVKQITQNTRRLSAPGRIAENTGHRRINPPTLSRVRLLEKILASRPPPPASRRF